jgi:uncharacterized protein
MLLIFGRLVVTLFLLVALVLSMTGFAGSVVAFLTAVIYGWVTGFQTMTGHVLLILFILTATAETIEVLSGTIGARTFHASKQAVWGSMIGLCLGFLFAFATFQFYLIPVGLVVGVVVGEQVAGRTEARIIFRSVVGVLIGKVGGIILKSIITLTMAIIIFVHLFP